MSTAPDRKSSFDFLKGLPDTGYRPWQPASKTQAQEEIKAGSDEPGESEQPVGRRSLSGAAALGTLLAILVDAGGEVPVDDFEQRAGEQGVETLEFYRALPTLVESQLATKSPGGFQVTDAGRKIAAFSAS